jgi:hypothetical protein
MKDEFSIGQKVRFINSLAAFIDLSVAVQTFEILSSDDLYLFGQYAGQVYTLKSVETGQIYREFLENLLESINEN